MRKFLAAGAAQIALGALLTLGAAAPAAARTNWQQVRQNAQAEVNAARVTAGHMDRDPQLRGLLRRAKGVYIVPSFGRGAFLVGGRGGAGVLLLHRANGSWSDPSFYNMGGMSIGLQAGASGGEIAFLLMDNDAVNSFKSVNNFSLNAGAGLSIVNYSANNQSSVGKGDIVFWSNTSGAYGGASVSGTDIHWNAEKTRAYYGQHNMRQDAVFRGLVHSNADNALQAALPF